LHYRLALLPHHGIELACRGHRAEHERNARALHAEIGAAADIDHRTRTQLVALVRKTLSRCNEMYALEPRLRACAAAIKEVLKGREVPEDLVRLTVGWYLAARVNLLFTSTLRGLVDVPGAVSISRVLL
jgi:hypothetical protein